MSALSRFRSWLGSVEFAVTATSVVVALAAVSLVFSHVPGERDAFALVILAGVAVPNIYADSWTERLDSRLAGVAWALLACGVVVVCYLLVSTGVRAVAGETAATVTGFVVTWLLGLVASRAAT
ncbi:hypothetical protein [Halobacterium noricense]|uniref:hypothetical protein n=1 Tax=Halobacterium noricense TaxID=223182 RepID=UPI001E484210|nr:hypothetical protein [Halobacterium noricense]UHH26219.1 hypothetical protein LT974_04610 [Halobacterium noricense]